MLIGLVCFLPGSDWLLSPNGKQHKHLNNKRWQQSTTCFNCLFKGSVLVYSIWSLQKERSARLQWVILISTFTKFYLSNIYFEESAYLQNTTNFKIHSFLYSPEHFLGYLSQDKCANKHLLGEWIIQQEDRQHENRYYFQLSSTQFSQVYWS